MNETAPSSQLTRRQFVKALLVTTGSLLAVPFFPATDLPFKQASLNDRLYRGTSDGRVLESVDLGKTWQATANFGKELNIQVISATRQGLEIQLAYQGLPIRLKSPNGRVWYSETWQAQPVRRSYSKNFSGGKNV